MADFCLTVASMLGPACTFCRLLTTVNWRYQVLTSARCHNYLTPAVAPGSDQTLKNTGGSSGIMAKKNPLS